MSDLYRPSEGRTVKLPSSNQDWPDSGLPADLSNPYVARLVRDGDLEKIKPGRRAAKNPAGDDA